MKTKSEGLFEGFLATNKLSFERIEVDTTPRPDYRVSVGGCEIIFELKELAEDGNFDVIKDPTFPHIKSSSRTMGDHIRRRIESSKKQIHLGPSKALNSSDLQRHRPCLSGLRHRANGFHRRHVWRIYDRHKQINQNRVRLVQWKGPDASREQEHVLRRRRPFVRPWWKDNGHPVRERLRQGQSPLQPVTVCFDVRRIDVSVDPLIVP